MEQYQLTETMQRCPKEQDLLTSINIFHVLIAFQTIAEDSLKVRLKAIAKEVCNLENLIFIRVSYESKFMKTTILFLAMAMAALGAVGATTAIINSATPAHACCGNAGNAYESHQNQGSGAYTGPFSGYVYNNGGSVQTGKGTYHECPAC